MSKKENFDVAIIGAGPGGYVAAIRAAQLGLKICIIEKSHLGGICLNWGCIPTKALLRSSEVNHLLHNLDDFGFSVENIKFDFKKIIERSRNVSKKLTNGIEHLMKKNKVPVFNGYAKLNGKNAISVREGENRDDNKIADIEAKHIVIATGARARVLPGLEPDKEFIWSYKEAMVPEKMPKSLLVVGSGAIGSEFASFYNNMGSDVTLVEVQDRILPVEDHEISAIAEQSFSKLGINIKTSTILQKVKKNKNDVTAHLEVNGKIEQHNFEKVIMAVGVVANTENIGLEGTSVKVEKSQILTDEFCETDEKNVYAIGDVAGTPWLAHKASHEGIVCIENIAKKEGKFNGNVNHIEKSNIPGCTYCMPQIASVGLTEKAAKEKGYDLKIGRFPYIGNGKAIALGEEEGLIKTIFDNKTGELLGAHMIGAEVTELIQGYVLGKTMEASEQDFMHTVFAHPTLSEMMHESVLDAYNKAIHV